MKIVECPICGSKFNIEKVPDGTKLKCGKCKKLFGVVQKGELVPILEETKEAVSTTIKKPEPVTPVTPAPPPSPKISPAIKKPEPVTTVQQGPIPIEKKPVEATPSRQPTSAVRTQSRIAVAARREISLEQLTQAKKAAKPDWLTVVGALVGLAGIGTLIYVWHIINQPLPGKSSSTPSVKPAAVEESTKK